MGYHYDGDAFLLVELLQKLHHFHAGFGVKGTGRFIGKDNLRLCDKGTGNCHALPLTAGHLVGKMLCPLREAQFLQVFHCHLVALLAGYALIEKRQLNILYGRFEANEVETLEDETNHPVAVLRRLALAEVLDEFPGKVIRAGVVVVKYSQYVEEGGFAGAGCSHYGNKLTALYVKVNTLEHVQRLSVVVSLVYVSKLYERHCFCCISMLLHCKDKAVFSNRQIFLQNLCQYSTPGPLIT